LGVPFKKSFDVIPRPKIEQKTKGIKVGFPFLGENKIERPLRAIRQAGHALGLIFAVKHFGEKSTARPVVVKVVAQLMGDGKSLLTVRQAAVHGDILRFFMRVQITSVVRRQVIAILNLETEITGHVFNRVPGSLVHGAGG